MPLYALSNLKWDSLYCNGALTNINWNHWFSTGLKVKNIYIWKEVWKELSGCTPLAV